MKPSGNKQGENHIGRRLFAKADVLLVIAILLAGAVLFYHQRVGRAEPVYAVVSSSGNYQIRVNLGHDREFPLPWNENVVLVVKNGSIAFLSSDCPDQICVKTGFIGSPGTRAVCLPNRVAVFVP